MTRSLNSTPRSCGSSRPASKATCRPSTHALRRCEEVAREVGQPLLRWRAAFLHTHRAFIDGQLEDAEQSALEALRFGEMAGQPDARGFWDIYLVRLPSGPRQGSGPNSSAVSSTAA